MGGVGGGEAMLSAAGVTRVRLCCPLSLPGCLSELPGLVFPERGAPEKEKPEEEKPVLPGEG